MLNLLVYSSRTCFSNLFLNNGMMFASFHSNGTIPSSNDKLNTVASGMLIYSTPSNSNLGGIPSTPGDLLSFTFLFFSYHCFGLQLVILYSLTLSLRT